ncbi:MAG: hypothetical protein Kow0081_0040 [Candidatus Dojkabacteria bacterium]
MSETNGAPEGKDTPKSPFTPEDKAEHTKRTVMQIIREITGTLAKYKVGSNMFEKARAVIIGSPKRQGRPEVDKMSAYLSVLKQKIADLEYLADKGAFDSDQLASLRYEYEILNELFINRDRKPPVNSRSDADNLLVEICNKYKISELGLKIETPVTEEDVESINNNITQLKKLFDKFDKSSDKFSNPSVLLLGSQTVLGQMIYPCYTMF